MHHAKGFGPPKTDMDGPEKVKVAKGAMGMDEGESASVPSVPKFHSMTISGAQNGVTVEHEKPEKVNAKGEMSGGYDPSRRTKHVFGHDHPVMKHINAIHAHCSGE